LRTRFVAAFRAEEEVDRLAGWVTSEDREVARWRRIVAETLREVSNTEPYFRELFQHFALPTSWRVDPEAGSVISHLSDRGLIVGLGSNYDSRIFSVLAEIPELGPLRGSVVVSSAVGYRKPATEFFREVVRAAGCAPEEVAFVGDDLENDYQGATAAGLHAVLLDSGDKHSGCDNRIKSLIELVGQRIA
jgi:putative hydrolase of the HAD superfamily